MSLRYVGSGPYCYANSLAMVLGGSTDPSVVEVLTGSPFGMWMLDGILPFFDPLGWDPCVGLDQAIGLLGWTCERTSGGTPRQAIERLRAAVAKEPVLAGPVEFGLLLHHPGSGSPIGSDHFVVVTGTDKDTVQFHDPHGHPHATLPAAAFAAAWRADTIGYSPEPFTMRTAFRAAREVDVPTALRTALPAAIRWLEGCGQAPSPHAVGGSAACVRLAELAEAGLQPGQRDHLGYFAIRVGARRLADAAYWLAQLDADAAAAIADRQARLVGGLQFPLVAGDQAEMARILRELAPTYELLRSELTAFLPARSAVAGDPARPVPATGR